jgi:hypothetical protein
MADEMIPAPVKMSAATTNQVRLQSTTPLETRIAQMRKQLALALAPSGMRGLSAGTLDQYLF